ncbi:ABC transporter ATP-binding protein [Dactylosporangium sp. AC04546]|uniref:ABC transporter ATP-binding protein n=1 Tax=Dactylosporangium sp. AC04546 TaxID=2862460 RepID=UPI001EE1470D|nr:ABC transporter ATP-binding protein [Dactylosporangium sp. AC04546]WVK87092.1 ABC transporter ATP-binding protein [Dactylosporangium sp. AC04546]
MTETLISVRDLRVSVGSVELVRGVSLDVARGTTVAVVGESGSGKSLTALSLMGLLPGGLTVSDGEIVFDGAPVTGLSERAWQPLRGKQIGMIFQDPLSALNPCLRVGDQIAEMFRRRAGLSRREAHGKVVEAMAEVGIPDAERRARSYPHEFSGGMRQRVMIAMAMSLHPQLLIADEPTTALDVTVQAQIMRLLLARKQARALTLILISHDLGVVSRSADTVVVMYAGRVVESGPTRDVLTAPAHPYTLGLMRSVPDRRRPRAALEAIPGQPPDPRALPAGCAFEPRCPMARDVCRRVVPELRPAGSGRVSACHFADELRAGARAGEAEHG